MPSKQMSRRSRVGFGELSHAKSHAQFVKELDKEGCSFGQVMSVKVDEIKRSAEHAGKISEENKEELSNMKTLARDTMGVASAAKKVADDTFEAAEKFKENIRKQWNSLWLQIVFGVILGNSAVFGLVYFLLKH